MMDDHDFELIDRLVDGELTDAQEREVIARLHEIPDGWRRCALAFLEARCWQRAASFVNDLSREAPSITHAKSACESPPDRLSHRSVEKRTPGRTTNWTHFAAIAALTLLAVGVGTFLPNPWQNSTGQRANQRKPAVPLAEHARKVNNEPEVSVAQDASSKSRDLLLGNLRLIDSSGHEFDVPVYDWDEQVARQLMYQSQPLPPEVVQQLKQHQVRSHRSYVPVRLEDGRQVILPVQELEIEPMRRPITY